MLISSRHFYSFHKKSYLCNLQHFPMFNVTFSYEKLTMQIYTKTRVTITHLQMADVCETQFVTTPQATLLPQQVFSLNILLIIACIITDKLLQMLTNVSHTLKNTIC